MDQWVPREKWVLRQNRAEKIEGDSNGELTTAVPWESRKWSHRAFEDPGKLRPIPPRPVPTQRQLLTMRTSGTFWEPEPRKGSRQTSLLSATLPTPSHISDIDDYLDSSSPRVERRARTQGDTKFTEKVGTHTFPTPTFVKPHVPQASISIGMQGISGGFVTTNKDHYSAEGLNAFAKVPAMQPKPVIEGAHPFARKGAKQRELLWITS
mmetsp:Transcript_32190/g.44657  ORF Transcript_32190/g.44657 Transcript_32190/m.44657 type:complete len:209 (-) Transcript_32190:314-940(-)|eukprot:CAMPEP_0196588646 /NCGR_PEP_ID=MMETSP1081-20130531/61217_1 /TAXON_ID=36882 /ORGANISM="Pyramimonas amylifera, Strain CCMP720" /LENGTH=208 /DNA_ID=CAMNT_0041911193 /DNA_START=208 /DNA_END=834 /DNA_ORIENTATION=+